MFGTLREEFKPIVQERWKFDNWELPILVTHFGVLGLSAIWCIEKNHFSLSQTILYKYKVIDSVLGGRNEGYSYGEGGKWGSSSSISDESWSSFRNSLMPMQGKTRTSYKQIGSRK